MQVTFLAQLVIAVTLANGFERPGLGVRFVTPLGISMLWCVSHMHVLAALVMFCPPKTHNLGPNFSRLEVELKSHLIIFLVCYSGALAIVLSLVISDGNCGAFTLHDMILAVWQRLKVLLRGPSMAHPL